MLIISLLLFPLAALADLPTGSDVTLLTGTKDLSTKELGTPTGSYQTFSSQVTLGTTAITGAGTTITGNATSATQTVTLLTGSNTLTSTTVTGNNSSASASTSTTSSPTPTNTTPCNGHAELCQRRYSNITVVGAHNSPFVRPGNAAANQELDVLTQLDDGVRFLQAQMQWPTNGSVPHFCHTPCDLLDAGPITDWLAKVKGWVASHPYDVVTVLLENGNYSSPALYAPFIEASGILAFAYQPPLQPMRLADWPTLSELILAGKRVVLFLDYNANQTAFPWLLDEFSQLWETPFDPVDRAFPCAPQRPPGLADADAADRLYLTNHNLNVEVSLLGASILVPATSLINQTNNATGYGSLGAAALTCLAQWGRPPNVLNVDYYNYGSPPGSVFEVAAQMNNVTYDNVCCGQRTSGAAVAASRPVSWLVVGALAAGVAVAMT